MIQYVSTKIVSAWPEARQDQPGYGIQHADGYQGWSPKELFEASSLVLGHIDDLEPYQQRLVAEQAQVDQRINDLRAFVRSGQAVKVAGAAEAKLMGLQLHAMELYSELLYQRVAKFTEDVE
jgi:hypothetical protein